jgi:outer membrane protein assembly factor BamB
MQSKRRSGLVVAILLALGGYADWPQFRGPGSLGVADNPGLPETWSQTENIAWKVAMPGMGWSSPCVCGNRIFLTAAISAGDIEPVKQGLYFGGERRPSTDSHRWLVMCIDLEDGSVLWQKDVSQGVPPHGRHLKNSFASETPICDGERVYAYIGNVGLFTFDLEGRELWRRSWKPVKTRHGWGTAASPYLHDDRLYVVNDNEGQSFLECVDAQDGRTLWRVERDEKSNWSPPYVWENDLRTEIVTTSSGKVRSYDLNGKELWTFSKLSTITVPAPFSVGGLLYFGSGYVGDQNRPFVAMKPGAQGDVSLKHGESSNAYVAWRQPKGASYMPTPIVYKERLYVLLDRGIMLCYNAKTGAPVYRQRFAQSRQFTASPLAWNGNIWCFGEGGAAVAVKAGDTFKEVARNELGELIMATPAIAGNTLVIRTAQHLYGIRRPRAR